MARRGTPRVGPIILDSCATERAAGGFHCMSRSLTTAVVSLFPPGRRFLTDLRNLQIAVRELQTERKAAAFAPPPRPDRRLNR